MEKMSQQSIKSADSLREQNWQHNIGDNGQHQHTHGTRGAGATRRHYTAGERTSGDPLVHWGIHYYHKRYCNDCFCQLLQV